MKQDCQPITRGKSFFLLTACCILSSALPVASVSASDAQPKDKHTYPAEVTKTFMKGCQFKGSKEYCTCIIDELRTKYSFEEFAKIDNDARENHKVPDEVQAIFSTCSKK